jgi:hypothetical protein
LSNSIEHVGNGWYRCVVSNSFTDSSVTRSQLQVQGYNGSTHSYTGTNQLDFYVWGPQLESASFSTSFIPSDTRFTSRASVATYYDETGILRKAPVNGARYGYEYDGRKWVETGLILENAATNTVSNSDFQEGWAFPNARHSYGNAITAPDGSQIRSVVTNSTYHLIRQSNVFDNTSAGTATLSFWAKAVSSTGTESVGFDFGDMAGSAYNSSTSQSLTSEWKRFTYTQTWTANQTAHNFLDFNLGNNTEVAIWGVQVETGNIATSYIPTYGVDVTRSADVVTSTAYTRERDYAIGHNLDKLLPSINEGSSVNMSAYVETSGIGHNTGFQTVGYLEDTSDFANNYIQLFSAYGGNNTIATAYNIGGTSANFGNWTTTASDITLDWKIAIGIEDGSQAAAANGTLGTLRSNTIPSGTFDILYIGNGYAGGRTMNGHIKKLSFYDQKLANAELQALTENN